MAEAASPPQRRKLAIESGSHVVLRDNEGTQKVFRLVGDKGLRMSRYPAIPLDVVVGAPYGAYLRYSDGAWSRQRQYSFEESGFGGTSTDGDVQAETAENNRFLAQDGSAQSLRPDEISDLKKRCSGEEVIAAIAASSSTFAAKTKFSQEKYLKKKQAKHIQQVLLLKPTVMELCETYMKISRSKVCGLRFDYISSILCQGDVHSGGRYLVLDCAMGLITGAMASQLGGVGRIFRVFSGGCSDKALQELDLGDRAAVVHQLPLDVLQGPDPLVHEWACLPSTAVDASKSSQGADAQEKSAADAARMESRVQRAQQRRGLLQDFLGGVGLDAAILVAGEGDELDSVSVGVLALASQRLVPGGRLVIFGHHLQPMAEQQGAMRTSGNWVDVRLTQLFTREYQVLPQRTHPHMAQDVMHCEGFLLVGTRVVDIPTDAADIAGADGDSAAKRQRLTPSQAE